tara:strand:+ start:5711 stop:5974 length:264 start_codon:yes stop_codon:yes gene_type:complete
MRKQIWHIELEYEWNTWRNVKGVRKDTKKKNKGTFITACVGDTVEELNNREYLISCIKNKIKSSQNVDIKITGWKWRKKCGVSNDVY